jgi:pyruvate dehydrogenase (quinone)
MKGIFVDDPSDLGSAWDEALAADRPVVLEVKTDPEVAPLPPHVTLKQAKNFMFALSKDEDAGHVIRDTARQIFNAALHNGNSD